MGQCGGVQCVCAAWPAACSGSAIGACGRGQQAPADLLASLMTAAHPAPPLRAAFEQHESLLGLLQQDLVKAMFSAAKQPSLACLSGVCQVAVALYVHLGRRLLLQLEALIGLLLLPLAEGKGVAVVEQQQAALEVGGAQAGEGR